MGSKKGINGGPKGRELTSVKTGLIPILSGKCRGNIPQRILYVNGTVFSLYLTFFDFLSFPSFYSMEMIAVGFAFLNEPLEASTKKKKCH